MRHNVQRKEEETCVSFNLIMKKGSRYRQLMFAKWAEPCARVIQP